MSFFSKIKNFVTGGGAKVSLDVVGKAERGSALLVRVTADVGDADLDIDHAKVKIIASEKVSIPNVEVANKVANETDEDDPTDKKTVRHSERTFDRDKNLTTATTLNANETYTWEAEIDIPSDALPTFRGRNAKHEWSVMAFLAVRGNDPDSGWVEFDVT